MCDSPRNQFSVDPARGALLGCPGAPERPKTRGGDSDGDWFARFGRNIETMDRLAAGAGAEMWSIREGARWGRRGESWVADAEAGLRRLAQQVKTQEMGEIVESTVAMLKESK